MKNLRKNMIEIILMIRSIILRTIMYKSHDHLKKVKFKQQKVYITIQEKFKANYNNIKCFNIDQYVTPLWDEYNKKLEKLLLPYPNFSFLRNPTIMLTMFMTG